MAGYIDELLVRLGFDPDTSGATLFDNRLTRTIGTVAKVGSAIGGVAMATGAYLFDMATDTARAVQETDKLANVAGVATSELQYLTVGAEKYGIEQDKLADILKDVNDKTGDYIANGGGAMKDFMDNVGKQAGLTAESFKGLSSSEALGLYVKTLEEANVSQAEMTFYMEALASDSTALVPLLRNGGEEFKKWGEAGKKSGRVMSEQAIENARVLAETVDKAKGIYSGLKNALIMEATPVFAEAVQWVIDHEGEIRAVATTLKGGFSDAFDMVGQAFDEISSAIDWAVENTDEIITKLKLVMTVAGIVALALGIMYAPAIAAQLSYLAGMAMVNLAMIGLKLISIASAIASGAAWLVAFAPFLLIAAVIAAIVAAIWYLWNNSDQVTALLKQAWASVTEFIRGIWAGLTSWFSSATASAVNTVMGYWNKLVSVFTGVVNTMRSIWAGLWNGAKAVAMGVINAIIRAITNIINKIGSAVSKVKDLAKYTPVGMAVSAGKWLGGKIAGRGGSSSSSVVNNQTFNVNSPSQATSIARGTTGGVRAGNAGVRQ